VRAIEGEAQALGLPPSIRASFRARARFSVLARNEPVILAAIVTMYIVLGGCTKATSTRYDSSTLPSAGVGALLALMVSRTDLGVIA